MVRAHSAVGSPGGLQTTGLAFSSAVKMRPSSAKGSTAFGHQNGKQGPVKSDQEDRLGYMGVVERCDSVEMIGPAPLKNLDASDKPVKQAIQPKSFQLGSGIEDKSPSWKALPSRAFASRPSSAHVQGHRGGHSFDRPMKPASPQIAVRSAEHRNHGWHGSPKRPEHPRPKPPHSNLNGIQGIGRQGPAKSWLERGSSAPAEGQGAAWDQDADMAPEHDAEKIEQLKDMLRRKEEEKRHIEQHNTVLAHQNAELKQQVAHMAEDFPQPNTVQRTRQRPWSASSAGSAGSISGRHALRIPNGAYRDARWQQAQAVQRSPARGNGSRAQSARAAPGHARSHVRGSAEKAYPPGFLVQTGYNLRGKPVYGFGSLEHRAVYTPCEENAAEPLDARDFAAPAGPDDRERAAPQPVVDKDDLFHRPNAVRQFPMRPARSRPQSANAAVRASSAHPVAVNVRPGSARTRSSYAERLQHQEADAFVDFHKAEAVADEGQELSDILSMMRAKAAAKHVRVIDFCLPFDKLRRGYMSSTEFRRALEAAGCFRDVEEMDLRRVIELFSEDLARSSVSVYKPGTVMRVGYAAFCEVLQPVGDKRVRLTEEQKLLMQQGKQRVTNSLDNPLGANELSKAGEFKVQSIVSRILDRSTTNRIPIRDLLGPLASAAKSSSVTPHMTNCPGCISRSQFLRGLQGCNLGIRFSDEDLALLFCKFERNGEFNYYRFCRDLEVAQQAIAGLSP